MRDALRRAGFGLDEIHASIWEGVADKSQLSLLGWAGRTLRWLAAYPWLIWRYLRAPAHDVVLVPYMGHLDVMILWPFAKLRGAPIVWDAFLSLHDTVVSDRQMVGRRNPLAWLVYGWEWLACRAASRVVLDTDAHAALFQELYGISAERTASVFVGAENEQFTLPPATSRGPDQPLQVLFYGQFIPLHGVETIVEAAALARDLPIAWHLVGEGQDAAKIRARLAIEALPKLRWTQWVAYEDLTKEIANADICLGIFGTSGKAARVIPNKVFQVLAAGKPLITRDSPAIRELVDDGDAGVTLVPPGDPAALVNALQAMANSREAPQIAAKFSADELARGWAEVVESAQLGGEST